MAHVLVVTGLNSLLKRHHKSRWVRTKDAIHERWIRWEKEICIHHMVACYSSYIFIFRFTTWTTLAASPPSRPSYLQHENPHTWERQPFYWDGALVSSMLHCHWCQRSPLRSIQDPTFNLSAASIASAYALTHWSQVTRICVSTLTISGSDNGLPGRRQAIILTNAGMVLIGSLGTYFNEILIEIDIFSFTKINLKMSSGKSRPFCFGLNLLRKNLPFVHSCLIPMYNARFILWPSSLSSPFLIWEENDGGHVE